MKLIYRLYRLLTPFNALKRLFYALWPEDTARQRCAVLQKRLPYGNCQPVLVDNLHITLVFLGSIEYRQEQALIAGTANLPMAPVKIVFDQLSFWKKSEVVCLTGNISESPLFSIVKELNALAVQLNIPVDSRPYQPHVTLARKAKQAVVLDFEPIVWHAEKFHLVESCSTQAGVRYRICHSWGGSVVTT